MSTCWYTKFPGDMYALGPFEFREPLNERGFRAYLREWHGSKRLPYNTQVWRA